jgi:hypothetical protein
MSKGMQQMRLIVMEFGRFTIDSAVEERPAFGLSHYAPGASRWLGTGCTLVWSNFRRKSRVA